MDIRLMENHFYCRRTTEMIIYNMHQLDIINKMTSILLYTIIMLSQLLNVIGNYSTDIRKINIEYRNKYKYYFADDITQFIECIVCKPSNKAYNYRLLMSPTIFHAYIRDKNLCHTADLPRNYV